MRKFLIAFLVLLGLPVLTPSQNQKPTPVLGAVVQTWHYDPQARAVIVRIVNTSDKDITAYNMSIVETYADHRVTSHEHLRDMLPAVMALETVKGTPDEERFQRELGSGTLAAHQSLDEPFIRYQVVIAFQATIDAVAYADGSAQATNSAALERLRDHRNAELRSDQRANQILKEVLGDSTIQNPAQEASTRLEKFLAAWKTQTHFSVDIEPEIIQSVVADLKRAPSVAAARHLGVKRCTVTHSGNTEWNITKHISSNIRL